MNHQYTIPLLHTQTAAHKDTAECPPIHHPTPTQTAAHTYNAGLPPIHHTTPTHTAHKYTAEECPGGQYCFYNQ